MIAYRNGDLFSVVADGAVLLCHAVDYATALQFAPIEVLDNPVSAEEFRRACTIQLEE